MKKTEHPNAQKPRYRRGCAGLFIIIMLLIGAAAGGALGLFVWILEDAQTTITALEGFRPKIGTKVYSFDGELLGEFAEEQRQTLPLSQIPLHVQRAFVATEDDKFFEHYGVRPDAIINAALYSIRSIRTGGSTRGGSTITQQVVRNVDTLGISNERTIQRKIREAIVALQVERQFTKDEILEMYLNQIFLGISAYGVEAASHQYYGKSCRDISLSEAATLAGLTRAPNTNNPIRNLENALTRRDIVLVQMLENDFITQEEHDAALAEDLAASVLTPEKRIELRAKAEGIWAANKFKAPYFAEEVRRSLYSQFEKDEILEDGMKIYTTLDMRLQRLAEEILETHLSTFDEKKLKYLTKVGKADEFIPVSGALVCIDNRAPYQGYVRAMVGGRDFDKEKYNTATQARRQPGSSVKPFVWAAAVAAGMTPSYVIVDEPIQRMEPSGEMWEPKNFGNKYEGPLPIRVGLEKSKNIISIKITEQLGVPFVRSFFERCGVTADVAGLSLALGTSEVIPINHAVAYSCFPNGGWRYDPVMINEIRNRDDLIRYDARDYAKKTQVLDPKVAYVVTHMMEGVCTPDGNLNYWPTGYRTRVLERPRGGKTGTTNSSRDVWFCGYTREFTCVVWLGYRDNRVLGTGKGFTGGSLACPIWTEFMLGAHEGLPVREFEIPFGVTFYDIDRMTGVLGGEYKEAYLESGPPPPTLWPYSDYAPLDAMESELLGNM